MGTEPSALSDDWSYNYFNYFTEIEEHFQRVRGSGLFLLSPVDWALIESWKQAGVPLEAVLRGVEDAFDKWRKSTRSKREMINSLAYCAQAVMTQAQAMAETGTPAERKISAPPFPAADLERYLRENSQQLAKKGFTEASITLEQLANEAEQHLANLEALEQRLTAMEERVVAVLKAAQTDEELLAARRDLDRQLRPSRSKMTAEQLSMLERQYMERRLLEKAGLPRLSLFYLR